MTTARPTRTIYEFNVFRKEMRIGAIPAEAAAIAIDPAVTAIDAAVIAIEAVIDATHAGVVATEATTGDANAASGWPAATHQRLKFSRKDEDKEM
jgi:hypothetical protein